MASGVYKTLANIRDSVISDSKESTNAIIVTQITRWANEAVENWAIAKKRDFFNKTFDIAMEPYVSTSWSVTSESTLVTLVGTGTIPVTSLNEHQFKVEGFAEVYNVTGMSATTLTLSSPFKGTTDTDVSGRLWQSSIFIDSSIRSIHKVYHEFFTFPIENTGIQELRDYIQKQPSHVDYAQKWSLYGLDLGVGADQRRLVIYPFPKEAYTLHVDANVYITPMSADADEPMVPLQYRQMIYWYCMGKLANYHGDAQNAGAYASTYSSIRAQLDSELMPEREFPQFKNGTRNKWIGRTQRGRGKLNFDS